VSTFRIICADVLDGLRSLPDESVHCCVTSPPYWGLRDYGTGTWEGGDAECSHRVGGQVQDGKAPGAITTGQRPGADASRCKDCGALRIDQQLGLERTPEEYVAAMVGVFREVRRVLRADGTCWMNLGDSYAGSWGAQSRGGPPSDKSTLEGNGHFGGGPKIKSLSATQIAAHPKGTHTGSWCNDHPTLKPKDLVGIPWRVAFALQADGWYLRSDIIWHKPNPMPESVTDRPTKAHEYLFLLTRSARYFYDAAAIAEPVAASQVGRVRADNVGGSSHKERGQHSKGGLYAKNRNRSAVSGVRPMGSGGGVQELPFPAAVQPASQARHEEILLDGRDYDPGKAPTEEDCRNKRSVWTVNTEPYAEAHFAVMPTQLVEPCVMAGSPSGGTVLDPFAGSGTVGVVALRHGRDFIGCELNPTYAEMARNRILEDMPMFNLEVPS